MDSEDHKDEGNALSPTEAKVTQSTPDSSRKHLRLFLAAANAVPWVGGLLAAQNTEPSSPLHESWLEEHRRRLGDLIATLREISERLEKAGEANEKRTQSEEYLCLVRKGFGVWDKADTTEKRFLVQKVLTNAGASELTSDDVVRLFIDWIEKYHEIHFAVIRVVHRRPGSTRASIWKEIRGDRPRDDSADADLFRLLIHDLTTGRVVRQHRETNYAGEFIKKAPKPKGSLGGVHKSAFDDDDEYELTDLGEQFVHYAMNELVPRFGK